MFPFPTGTQESDDEENSVLISQAFKGLGASQTTTL